MSKMAAFIAGLGGGYMQAKDKALQQKRQDEQDAWIREQRDRQRMEWKEADQIKQDMRDAAAPRTTMNGYMTQSADGQKLFSADAGQAAQIKSMQDSIAELEGTAPSTQTQGHAITGNMSKGHQIGAGAAPDVSKINDPIARMSRQAEVYSQHGQVKDSALMYNTAFDTRLKELNLGEAEGKYLKDQFNKSMRGAIIPGDVKGSLENIVSKAEWDGLRGMTGRAELGADGRYRVYAVSPDGKQHPLPGTYENSHYGVDAALAAANKYIGADEMLKQIYSEAQRAKDAEKSAAELDKIKAQTEAYRAAANARNAKVGINPNTGELDPNWAVGGGGRAGGGSRGGGAQQGAGLNLPDPMAGFDSKKAFAVAAERAVAELGENPQKPPTAEEISARTTKIYRALEREFRVTGQAQVAQSAFARAAANAKTPQEIQELTQKGFAIGLTQADMAAIDPRFAQPTSGEAKSRETQQMVKTSPPQRPELPMSAFAKRQQAAMEMERRQRAEAEAQERARLEAERQRRLQGRPDLQQMGGMRYFN